MEKLLCRATSEPNSCIESCFKAILGGRSDAERGQLWPISTLDSFFFQVRPIFRFEFLDHKAPWKGGGRNLEKVGSQAWGPEGWGP